MNVYNGGIMFWLVLAFIIILAAWLWMRAPQGFVVHAARSKDLFVRKRRFPLASLYRDAAGQPIDLENKLIGLIKGDSGGEYGLRDGDVIIAKTLSAEEQQHLQPDQLVVIDSPLDDGTKPYRMRKIRSVADGMVVFYDDPFAKANNQPLNSKPASDVVAKLEFVGHY